MERAATVLLYHRDKNVPITQVAQLRRGGLRAVALVVRAMSAINQIQGNGEPLDELNVACFVVRPEKAGESSGSQSRRGNNRKPRSLNGRQEGNRLT